MNRFGLMLAACLVSAAAAQVPYNPSAAAPAPARGGRGPAMSPKQASPIDMTGYWVSIVTEDWKFRMVTPAKGNSAGVPLNAEGRKVTAAWDPAKDDPCKWYGAAGLMRIPGRIHITWDNETTMRIDTDAGSQTRTFHFGGKAPEAAPASLQGYSIAEWEPAGSGRGPAKAGDLKVVTTHLAPGFLRKNGVPYSAETVLTEYYDRITTPTGDQWLVVTTEVKDPVYLSSPFITSTHFKKQADAAGWMPDACAAK